jgi:hypothetical protein
MRCHCPLSGTTPENLWRKMLLIVESDVGSQLYDWHGGQSSATYRLASWADSHLVSVSMVEDAMDELESVYRRIKADKNYSAKDRRELKNLIDVLHDEYMIGWAEHDAAESGMSMTEDEYRYDDKDYGLSPEDEAEKVREMRKYGGGRHHRDLSGAGPSKMLLRSVTNHRGVAFNVVVVPTGARYGLEDRLVANSDQVEFYDSRYPHTEFGQFVARYNLDIFVPGASEWSIKPGRGVDLVGYEPAWKLTPANVADVIEAVGAWVGRA